MNIHLYLSFISLPIFQYFESSFLAIDPNLYQNLVRRSIKCYNITREQEAYN